MSLLKNAILAVSEMVVAGPVVRIVVGSPVIGIFVGGAVVGIVVGVRYVVVVGTPMVVGILVIVVVGLDLIPDAKINCRNCLASNIQLIVGTLGVVATVVVSGVVS